MKKVFYLVLCFIFLMVGNVFANTLDVNLTWNKPDDTRVVGYYVYVGNDLSSLTEYKVVGPDTLNYVFTGLEFNHNYIFTAKSYDENDNRSSYSEILNYTTPEEPEQTTQTNLIGPKGFNVEVDIKVTPIE